jgi:hypothetical protein
MRPLDLLRLLFAQPFVPFRLYVLENTVFEVRHPELANVGRSTLMIHVPQANPPLPIGMQPVIVSLRHITRIEFLPSKATGSNGG